MSAELDALRRAVAAVEAAQMWEIKDKAGAALAALAQWAVAVEGKLERFERGDNRQGEMRDL